jgi:hypothetical protein
MEWFGYCFTTGKPVFAVRQNLCRAFYFGRTAKSLFAVRFLYSARQRKKRTPKKLFAVRLGKTHGKHVFAVRFYYSARQSIFYLFSLGPKSNYS